MDNYSEVREVMGSFDFDSKERSHMNKMISRTIPEFEHVSAYFDRDSIEKVSFKLDSGYSLVSDYHVKASKNGDSNGQTYRTATGFNVYKETNDGGWVEAWQGVCPQI